MQSKIEGMAELEAAFKRLGKMPSRALTPAVKKGTKIWEKAAKSNAPEDTGLLKKAITTFPEKSKKKGKKVFRIVFDKAYNDDFQKKHKPGTGTNKTKRKADSEGNVTAYYPASQEYGFFAKNGRYIPGYHYMRDAAEQNAAIASKVIISELTKKAVKEWNKKNGI